MNIEIPLRNSVISSNDIPRVVDYFKKNIHSQFLRIYGDIKKQFTIDLARALIMESMKTSDGLKHILILGESFREEAQNALLKTLEDTPRNVVIYIFTNNMFTLLPTLKSRLHKFKYRWEEKQDIIKDEIDYLNMTERQILKVLIDNKRATREKVADIIRATIKLDAINNRKSFSLDDLDKLTKLLHLLKLNSPPAPILASFVLMLHEKYLNKYNLFSH